MSSIEIADNNIDVFLKELQEKRHLIHEAIGVKAEKYAKARCPVGTPESTGKKGYRGGTLRNSITHDADSDMVAIGSNVEYAPYVELGTGPYFETPPEWEQFSSVQGSGGGHGYVHPRPYLKPAILDHVGEYEQIAGDILKK